MEPDAKCGGVTVYAWRIKDRRTGRWRTLRWKMTEGDAAAWAATEGVEVELVPRSGEFRHPAPWYG